MSTVYAITILSDDSVHETAQYKVTITNKREGCILVQSSTNVDQSLPQSSPESQERLELEPEIY